MGIFSRKKQPDLKSMTIPAHVAVIMDGNGRWAKKRALPRTAGHAAGAETFRRIATYCKEIGIQYFTVYAFSTENWKRPADEVASIMSLLEKYLLEAIEKMRRDNIRLRIMGDTAPLSPRLKELAAQTEAISDELDGFQVNLCLNYGGRDEILHAVRRYASDLQAGTAPELTEDSFSNYLYFSGIPEPDLIIRPSGEVRISNFLTWESAYSEFYFTDTLWPDFSPRDMDAAIAAYNQRERRFGGIK